jgi:uroporphyrinogen decarboxylase
MTLTHKERMRRALQHEPVDRIPSQINYTDQMGKILVKHFGVSSQELLYRLDNHMIRVDLKHTPYYNEDGSAKYDWWGVGWDTVVEGYWPADAPFANTTDLDSFTWPDPHQPEVLDDAARIMQADNGQHFITPNFGFCLYERAWSMRGFEQLNMDMVLDLDFVEALMDRIVDIQLVLINRYIELGVDGGYFGDDYGAQQNMLFSPKIWRKLIKPRLAKMFAPFRAAGLPVILHSDGDIDVIMPDLVEVGLTVFNPVQPEVTDHHWLRKTFGTNLAYYGGVSTQTVMPFGTPDEVRAATRACATALAPNNTGLVIAPSHRMMVDIPMPNLKAFMETCAELRFDPAVT